MKRAIVGTFMSLLIVTVACAVIAAYAIEMTIENLQANIEERALPVLRIDVPELRSKLSPLNCLPFCSTLAAKMYDAVKWPVIKAALNRTRDDLNNELTYVKVVDLTYEETDAMRTIIADCSFGIKVIITGQAFNDIISVKRPTWFTLQFTCD